METTNLDQLALDECGAYLLGGIPFSGFAIETFPDGSLQTQISLMHGRQDGVTRTWHPNGQLESEKSFRNGQAHGRHWVWERDGTLSAELTWNMGAYDPSTGETRVTRYEFDSRNRQTRRIDTPSSPPLFLDENADHR